MKTTKKPIPTVRPHEVGKTSDKILLLDVRTPAEFEEAHIPGSHLHPLTELDAEKVKAVMQGKEQCVIVCRSGNRARQAAEKLAAAGLDCLCVLEGGVQAWDSHGLPLNRGRKTISLERQVRIAAGAIVLTGALLAWFVNPAWVALSGFVGAGLIFAGVTDWCGLAIVLARMPWNSRRHPGVVKTCSVQQN